MATPTLRELLGLEAKQTRLVAAAERWLLGMLRNLQRDLYRRAVESASAFLYRNGSLALTVTNTRRAASAALTIEAAYKTGAKEIAAGLMEKSLDVVRGNTEYFSELGDAKSVEARAMRRVLMLYGYDPDSKDIIPGGYLDGVLGSAPVARTVGAQMNTALLGGMGVADFRDLFRVTFAPGVGTGMLERHFERFSHDVFMQINRVSKIIYAQQLGLVHFVYAGTEVTRTRDFCFERMNRIYTVEFSETWNQLEWDGKIPDLLFEIQMGGYYCRHSQMFISAQMAAMLAKKRNIEIDTLGPPRERGKKKDKKSD